jgi:hypothetical protein
MPRLRWSGSVATLKMPTVLSTPKPMEVDTALPLARPR